MIHLQKAPRRLGTLLLDYPNRTDLAAAGTLLVVFLIWAVPTDASARAATLPASTRSAIYISAATTTGALLGFVITALSVLLALPSGRRLDYLRGSKAWPKFPKVFVRTAWTLGAATVVFTTAIVVDDNKTPSTAMESLAIVAATFTVLRISASVLLLGRLVQYSFDDQEDSNNTSDDDL